MLTLAVFAAIVFGAASIALAIDNRRLRKLIAPFDRDHSGAPGGSRPKT